MHRPVVTAKALLGFALLLFGVARADLIVKTNGEEIRGRVVQADTQEVQIEVGGILLHLPRNEVLDVQYDDDTARLREQIGRIRGMTQQGRLLGNGEALDSLKSAAQIPGAVQNDTLVKLARTVGEEVFKRLDAALHTASDSTALVAAVDRLLDQTLQPLWKAAYPDQAFYREFLARAYRFEGAGYLLRARSRIIGQQRDLEGARVDLDHAAQYLGPQDFLNGQYVNLEDYRWAVYWQIRSLKEKLDSMPPGERQLLSPAQDIIKALFENARATIPGAGLAPIPLTAELYDNLNYLENWFRDNKLVYYTALQATPVAPPRLDKIWTPLPTPTPTPSPTELPASALSDTFQTLKSQGLLQAWYKFKKHLGAFGGYLKWAIYGLGALVAWVVIPRLVLRMRERRGDLVAVQFRAWPKISGWVALVAYVVVAVKSRPKRAKHKCPFCNFALDDIESYGDMNFVACPNCHQTITPVYDLEDYIEYLVEAVKRELEMSKMGAVNLKSVIEKDAMTKLVRAVMTLAVRRRSSDLHVEPEAEGVKLRARIDGMLQELTTMPKVLASPIVSALKVMGNLDIAERRVPQDGRFQIWVDKADIDIRIASAPGSLGEKCSLRLLDSRTISVDASRLGMSEDTRSTFERTIRLPHGMLLVTGPTGSGKSTTLYVALQQINTGEKNIISIEDPVEFKIKGVNQMQVNVAANFTFATGLRGMLRQDPDVIMVGEIRDRETADIAIEAAMTGHLVLSTLHTIDSATAIGRLVDLDVEPRRFADALQVIIAQRLLRLNCSECAKPYKPKKSELESVGLDDTVLSDDSGWKTLKGTGCDLCRFTGYFGRIGLFETLIPDDEIRDLIESKANTGKIRQAARTKGMRTLREEGLSRVKEGLTTLEEVIRVTA